MELAAFASFAALVMAWIALPLRRTPEVMRTIEPDLAATERKAA